MSNPTMTVYFRDHVDQTFDLAGSLDENVVYPDAHVKWLIFSGKGGPIILNADDVMFISVDNGEQS